MTEGRLERVCESEKMGHQGSVAFSFWENYTPHTHTRTGGGLRIKLEESAVHCGGGEVVVGHDNTRLMRVQTIGWDSSLRVSI